MKFNKILFLGLAVLLLLSGILPATILEVQAVNSEVFDTIVAEMQKVEGTWTDRATYFQEYNDFKHNLQVLYAEYYRNTMHYYATLDLNDVVPPGYVLSIGDSDYAGVYEDEKCFKITAPNGEYRTYAVKFYCVDVNGNTYPCNYTRRTH